MREQGSLLGFLKDPRLAPYATSDIPAWLWSADATRILWGNPAAAAIFIVCLLGKLHVHRSFFQCTLISSQPTTPTILGGKDSVLE